MLHEIICESFNENNQKISFHSGLNVVLGDDTGTNSIGKSTFLMIIDFVFGGDDYIKLCSDVHRHIKGHQIKFSFAFDSYIYKFVRGTNNPYFVYKCNNEYEILEEMSIENYRDFLKTKYKIVSDDLSFRDTISGYYRIYQRNNYNEHKPFQFFEGESKEKSVIRLLKLYDLYETIEEYEKIDKENLEKLNVYKKSIKHGYLPQVTKQQYESYIKEIEKENEELSAIAVDLDRDTLDIENLQTSEIRQLKDSLALVRSKLTRYENKKKRLQYELSENISPTISDEVFFEELKSFFPSVQTEKLSNVDTFHKGLFGILKNEVKHEIDELDMLINKCKEEIDNLLQQLNLYQNEKPLSKIMLTKIETVVSHKNELIAKTNNYDKLKSLNESKKQSSERLTKEMDVILLQLQTKINCELDEINANMYETKHQAPILSLRQKNYDYNSIDDNGTGTNYKNLIILDLCLLKQTFLPSLIHDSLLFKNIGDEPLEKIFMEYTKFDKQIFIAFDRLSTYSEKIQNILNQDCILKLGDDVESLFGFTWRE